MNANQHAAQTFLQSAVTDLLDKAPAATGLHFVNGVWTDHGATACFRCNAGPGVAAAVDAATTGNAKALTVALQTFDTAIQTHQLANGAFGPPAAGEDGPAIQTTTFANELGEAYVVLGSKVGAARQKVWATAIRRAADYLIANGNLTWYTNGNITLANALTMAFAAKVTNDPKYLTDYKNALAFALAPPQARWPGFGLHITKAPKSPTGSDGAGYLSESGTGGSGYDPDYTQVQADVVSWLYLVEGDAASLRLLNLLVNQLLARVNTTTWMLDTSGGTRHPQPNRRIDFDSAGLIVLSTEGNRTDLQPHVSTDLAAIVKSYLGATSTPNPAQYYGYGSEAAAAVYALSK